MLYNVVFGSLFLIFFYDHLSAHWLLAKLGRWGWWYLVAMETCVTLFWLVHSIGAINVCTNFEINRYKIDELRKHAKCVCFIWRHVTQNSLSWRLDSADTYLDQEHLETKQKFLRLPVLVQKLWLKQWFSWFWWPWPLFYFLPHALGMKYWNLQAKFHKNQSSINGWHTHTYTPKVKSSLANPFGARLTTIIIIHEHHFQPGTNQWLN